MQLTIYGEPTRINNFNKNTVTDPITGNKVTVWFGEFSNGDFSLTLDNKTNQLSGYISRYGELSTLDSDTAIEIYNQIEN